MKSFADWLNEKNEVATTSGAASGCTDTGGIARFANRVGIGSTETECDADDVMCLTHQRGNKNKKK